jgi:hypothetical protein
MRDVTELSIAEKLMLLALYVNGGKMEWEKLKWATFILLKAHEEGMISLEGDLLARVKVDGRGGDFCYDC